MTAMTTKPRILQRSLLASVVASALLATACGNAAVPLDATAPSVSASPAASPVETTGTPAATPTPSAETSMPTVPGETTIIEPGEKIVVDGRTVEVPPGLRFPEDAKISDSLGRVITFTAPGAAEFAVWFRAELPRAGYEVITDLEGSFMAFDGRGWGGTLSFGSDSVDFIYGEYEPEGEDTETDTLDDYPMTPRELNITGVPFHFRFPPSTEIMDLNDTPTGSSFTIIGPSPADVLEFYENNVLTTVHFDILEKKTSGAETTITFTNDDGWIGTMVFGDEVRVSFESPNA